jgi:hypothetical protein
MIFQIRNLTAGKYDVKNEFFKTYIKEVILPNLTTIEGFQRVNEVQEEKLGVQNESNKISFQFYN